MNKAKLILAIILLIATFTRFYRIDATITFLEDEGRDLLVVKRLLDTARPIALGPQTSTGNMYLGPFYYYFIAPALVISNFHPIGPTALIAVTGVITTYLLYVLGSKWFGKTAGLIAASLFAVMPAAVHMSRNSWNPNLMPFISTIFIYLAHTVVVEKKQTVRNMLLLGVFAGILVQLHYMSLVIYIPLSVFFIKSQDKDIKKITTNTAIALIGFALSLLPYIIFEVKNDFVNTNSVIRFIKSEDQPNIRYTAPVSHVVGRIDVASKRLFGSLFGHGSLSPEPYSGLIAIIFFILITISLIDKKISKSHQFLSVLLLGSIAIIGLYQENIHLHYLGFLYPLVLLISSHLATSKLSVVRIATSIAIIMSVIYTIPQTAGYLRSGETNQIIRPQRAAQYISTTASNREYNVVSAPDTNTSPYQYFLSLSQNKPSNELQDTLFIICQDKPCSADIVDNKLLYITGPSHPSIPDYLYHPLYNYFPYEIEMISNEHISHGVWVAETRIIIE